MNLYRSRHPAKNDDCGEHFQQISSTKNLFFKQICVANRACDIAFELVNRSGTVRSVSDCALGLELCARSRTAHSFRVGLLVFWFLFCHV